MTDGIFFQPVFDFVGVFVNVDPIELWRIVGDGRDVAFAATTPFGIGVREEITCEEMSLGGFVVVAFFGEEFGFGVYVCAVQFVIP